MLSQPVANDKLVENFAPADFRETWPQKLGKTISGVADGLFGTVGYTQDITSAKGASYTMLPEKFYHPKPTRNALGLVGGNEVSVVDTIVDVESDLRGITRNVSKCPSKKYIPELISKEITLHDSSKRYLLERPECAQGGATSCPAWPDRLSGSDNPRTGRGMFDIPNPSGYHPRHLPDSQLASYQAVQFPKRFTMETGTTYRF